MRTSTTVARSANTDEDSWFDQTMRFLQVNLVEDDPLLTDVAAWAEYWKTTQVDGVAIAAAGAVAYYPTDVPLHPRSQFLGSMDLFGELCAAAKDQGIRVLARFEPNFASREVYEAQPGWFRRDRNGQPTTAGDLAAAIGTLTTREAPDGVPSHAEWLVMEPDQFQPCWHGPYYDEFIPRVMSELAERYPIDGFFANGWPQPLSLTAAPTVAMACYCPSCLEQWAAWPEAGGVGYPEYDDPADPRWHAFVAFIQHASERVQRLWLDHARSLRPGLTFSGCSVASVPSGLRWRKFPLDLYAQDCQGRGWDARLATGLSRSALWQPGRSAKMLKAVARGAPAFQIVGSWKVGHETIPSLRRLGQEPREMTLLMAQAVAKDNRIWSNVGGGTIYDRRWMAPLSDFFNWHHGAQEYLRDRRSRARIALVWSPTSAWQVLAGGGPSVNEAMSGWYLALLRARIPCDVILEDDLPTADVDQYHVIVVPSGTRLGPAAAAVLSDRDAAGRGLVVGCGVVFDGQPVDSAPGFGGDVLGPVHARYLELGEEAVDHPLLVGLGDTDYLPAGTWFSAGDAPTGSAAGRLTPRLPFLADTAWFRSGPDSGPLLVADEHVVALGTDLDAFYGSTQMRDAGLVLTNSIQQAAGGRQSNVLVDGAGLIDVDVWEQDSSLTVHLVNFTTPEVYGGATQEIAPLGPLRVQVRLPQDRTVTRVRLLVDDSEVDWTTESLGDEDWLGLVVPRLDTFEVVAIDTNFRER